MEIIDYRGRTPPYSESGIPHLRSNNVKNGKIIWRELKYVSEETYKKYMTRGIPKTGDFLFTTEGPLGEVSLVPEIKFSVAQRIMILRPRNNINSKFLMYQIMSEKFRSILYNKGTGSTIKGISSRNFEPLKILIAPLKEQKRIVSKLEELFTKLDAGIEYLIKIQILLKQYRQSILKYAFEGKLTEKWREEHKNELSSSPLERIITYQNNKLEIEQIERSSQIYGIYRFPKEWTWIRIKHIAEKIQYGSSEKAIGNPNGIPVLRMGNIYEGKISYDNLKYYSSDWNMLNEFLLQDGDVLFNRTNSAELVGKTAVYYSFYPKSVFASYLIRIKILKNYYSPKILSYFINSIYGRKYIKSVVSQQVGQANVNGTKLSLMPIPLMSLLEQFKMIEEIEKKISKIENASKIIEKYVKYSLRLKSIILKYAFEGKLASQDPNDEPADVLLERIKKQRELTITIKKEKSKITKKKSNDIDNKQMRLM